MLKHKLIIPKIQVVLEKWKFYQALNIYVSTEGRIKDENGNIMNLCKYNNYLWCKGRAVHRIVMEAWAPVDNYAALTVDHKNHNTYDNRVCNLEWVTPEENQERAVKDMRANSPKVVDTKEKTKENDISKLVLNGVTLSYTEAKTIIMNIKGIQPGTKTKLDKALISLSNGDKDVITIGNCTITKVKE